MFNAKYIIRFINQKRIFVATSMDKFFIVATSMDKFVFVQGNQLDRQRYNDQCEKVKSLKVRGPYLNP